MQLAVLSGLGEHTQRTGGPAVSLLSALCLGRKAPSPKGKIHSEKPTTIYCPFLVCKNDNVTNKRVKSVLAELSRETQ